MNCWAALGGRKGPHAAAWNPGGTCAGRTQAPQAREAARYASVPKSKLETLQSLRCSSLAWAAGNAERVQSPGR